MGHHISPRKRQKDKSKINRKTTETERQKELYVNDVHESVKHCSHVYNIVYLCLWAEHKLEHKSLVDGRLRPSPVLPLGSDFKVFQLMDKFLDNGAKLANTYFLLAQLNTTSTDNIEPT